MNEEDVSRLAQAIASANGHPESTEWASKVVEAWKTLAPQRRDGDIRADVQSSINDVRGEA